MGRRGYCSIANGGCAAPAGHQCGLGGPHTVAEPQRPVKTCAECGDDVCGNEACSRLVHGKRICAWCEEGAPKAKSARKPYTRPRLTNYGPVARRSLGGSGTMQEGMTMALMMRFP